jgi:DNA primase
MAGGSRPEGRSAVDQEHNSDIGEVPATNLSGRHHGSERFDVAALRRAHPIETVVASSGVELTRRGQGFMGCCPFHDDSTASLSVGGVPDRFHCFGCGAGGDVIEYVARFTGLSFVDVARALESGTVFNGVQPASMSQVQRPARPAALTTTAERAHAINHLAWEFFTTPAKVSVAESYLRETRGIDVGALCAGGGEPVVGFTRTDWRALTRHLLRRGVTDNELLELDLAQRSRNGDLVDTYRGRLIVPVQRAGGCIDGFIGRDTTGDPRAPKYRNPTRTPTFDKSTALYRPSHHGLDRDANVVVVEGALDALAIAATAALGGELSMFAPVTTSGVTVSAVQAQAALALHPKPPVIALDGDRAGRAGTDRWLRALCLERSRPALVSRLPDGLDPAEWLRHQGVSGLPAFDRRGCLSVTTDAPRPQLPGRDLVRICFEEPGEPVRRIVEVLTHLDMQLRGGAACELIEQAEFEMTVRGWNPRGEFARSVRDAIAHARRQAADEQRHRTLAAREGLSQLSTEWGFHLGAVN